MLKVEVLGSGGAFDKFSTAYLINDHVLIDCGMEIVKELIQDGRLAAVDHLFITHLHQDHVAGLELLIYYRRYNLGKTQLNVEEFTIHAGPDFIPYYSQLKCCYSRGGMVVIDFTLAKPIETPVYIKDVAYSMPSVIHIAGSVPSFAVRAYELESNSTVLISGDTDSALHLADYDVDLVDRNTLVFHDMGWQGLDHILNDKAHPTEYEVFAENGDRSNLIGVHTTRPLEVYRRAEKNEVFYAGQPQL